jgi:predicted molibdopterin-dependent oxidoreductase YjgC
LTGARVAVPLSSWHGTFTNGERRVQRVRKALAPPGAARADWEILCGLMAATALPQAFEHPAEIMAEIGRVAPACQ